ncbi:MAG TPA: hypothetical protein ENH82_06775 [bacterium]|nr:hypothetical protein [bacterium]
MEVYENIKGIVKNALVEVKKLIETKKVRKLALTPKSKLRTIAYYRSTVDLSETFLKISLTDDLTKIERQELVNLTDQLKQDIEDIEA